MSTQLAFGLTAGAGSRGWLPTSGGRALPTPADDRAHPPGSPVAVGPAEASDTAVRAACLQLTLLVGRSIEAAAAGVDLGGGFTSARLAGVPGDRRDAVLAALQVLGPEESHRLGERAAVLVALFGTSATKRVGAAAHTAVAQGRWAALRLASAASDLLGPEQLEQLLDLRAPQRIDPFPRGAASTLAGHLARVLEGYPKPRRLALILSLWEQVCADQLHRQRLDRLAARRTKDEQVEQIRERHQYHLDEAILGQMRWSVPQPPTVAAAARWKPPRWWPANELRRLLHDAVAATALLRLARTVSDEGLAAAAAKHHAELVAADACLDENARSSAGRRPGRAHCYPTRPGVHLHELVQVLDPARKITGRTENAVGTRLTAVTGYGVVVFDAVSALLTVLDGDPLVECCERCGPWQADRLRGWRAAAGFTRAAAGWEQPPLADGNAEVPATSLAQRLAAEPGADPAEVELPHDLLWFADLADALAPFHGHESARVQFDRPVPELDYQRPQADPAPARAESVPLAVAEVAQLVAFGAAPPPRCRSWAELAGGVRAAAAVAEASVGAFPVPAEVSTVDKSVVPGAGLVVELGRQPHQLAAWSGYMGNCIGETWYAEHARRGQCVLMALRHPAEDRIVANLDIRRHTGGWHIHELRARFNDELDPALADRIKQWVGELPAPAPTTPEPLPPAPPVRARGGGARRSAAARLPAELIRALTAEVERQLATAPVGAAQRTYADLAAGLGRPGQPADFDPPAAVIALKRLSHPELATLIGTALAAGLEAATLWQATRIRPLTTAVHRLAPALREHDRISALTEDAPLPRSLRALVRRAELVPARALDVVARTVRAAIGELWHDPALGRSVARRPTPELVCALAIAATCAPRSTMDGVVRVSDPKKVKVPGFPVSDLFAEDGPWQQALPAAAELGAPVAEFAEHIAERGLLIPETLLDKGGWPALWQRAH